MNLKIAVIGFAALIAGASRLMATDTAELPIARYSAPYEILVSTWQYTNVVSADVRAVAELGGIILDNPLTNSKAVRGHFGGCSSTSVSTSTVRGPLEIPPSSNTNVIRLASDVCLWLLSTYDVQGESVTVQGYSQYRR